MEILFDFMKIVIPSLLVLGITYMMMRSYFDNQVKMKQIELEQDRNKLAMQHDREGTMVRLQAYERLILLLERNHPMKLLSTVAPGDLTAYEYHMGLLATIRNEMDYNLTQQLYVSDDAWNVSRSAIEELISIINLLAKQIPNDSTGRDLGKKILNYFMDPQTKVPNDSAIRVLKSEARTLLT